VVQRSIAWYSAVWLFHKLPSPPPEVKKCGILDMSFGAGNKEGVLMKLRGALMTTVIDEYIQWKYEIDYSNEFDLIHNGVVYDDPDGYRYAVLRLPFFPNGVMVFGENGEYEIVYGSVEDLEDNTVNTISDGDEKRIWFKDGRWLCLSPRNRIKSLLRHLIS
jgi:hypothetical protein